MIISYPGNASSHGSTCETITELIDLYPTLAGLCGLSEQQPGILQGRNLAPYIMENRVMKEEGSAYTISYGGEGASVRTSRWRYTRWGEEALEGHEELYDHLGDPEETINLADRPDKADVLAEMRRLFEGSREKALGRQLISRNAD